MHNWTLNFADELTNDEKNNNQNDGGIFSRAVIIGLASMVASIWHLIFKYVFDRQISDEATNYVLCHRLTRYQSS